MTPGEGEAAEFELARAEEDLAVGRSLLQTGAAEAAVNRIYYAAFHAARAALLAHGLHAKSHSGQILVFEREFGSAPTLARLFSLRGRADYGLEPFVVSPEALRTEADAAQAFLGQCRTIVRSHEASDPDPKPDL